MKTGVLALVAILLGGLLAEAIVRGYTLFGSELGIEVARRDPFATLCVPHGEFGYRQRPGIVWDYPNGTRASSNALGYRGPLVSLEKPSGTFRIILLGGSATHGWWVDDDETIDAHMRELLAEHVPDRRYEVVNLALDGYDSYQLFERMRSDGVRLDPDLVIVNARVNDVRNARIPDLKNPDPRTLIWETAIAWMREEERRGSPFFWTRTKHLLYVARLPGILRERLTRRAFARENDAPVAGDAALDYFETNLERTADLADQVGAALLLSAEPSSLGTRYAPTDRSERDYWIADAATTQRIRDALAARMQALAKRLHAQGRRVQYVHVDLPPDDFIDDCHLTGTGNRDLARSWVGTIETAPEFAAQN